MKLHTPVFVLVLFVAIVTSAGAQISPAQHAGTAGAVAAGGAQKERLPVPFQTLAPREWVGRHLVFLPKAPSLRIYGYLAVGVQENDSAGLRQYQALAGKIGAVTAVDGDDPAQVSLKMENGETLTANAYTGVADGLGPEEDIDSARARYKGATLWARTDYLVLTSPKDDSTMTTVRQNAELKVIDVAAGAGSEKPVRFIVRVANGKEWYADVHLSNTNVPEAMRKYDNFHDTFYDVDPKTVRQWPAGIRKAIEEKRAVVGMTARQVRMALGEPDGVYAVAGRPDAQQWVFAGGASMKMEGEKVTAIGE
ncbi:MAG: hypothetical protein JST22_13915 [Bacteroidetes bacterium]|nr:hypothetical protein [Bacteroidota bacterium]